jgi:succinyl-CoA synthetase alpha subunit/GNAT superfamily N-acetyltransferase
VNRQSVDYESGALLQDGGSVAIRALRYQDRGMLLDLFNRLSARSLYFRFFRHKHRLTDADLAELTNYNPRLDFALGATTARSGRGPMIGVGRYTADAAPTQSGRSAEVAFAVADEDHGRGVGTLLLEHLARMARSHGIVEFRADVLPDNTRMIAVFDHVGFPVSRRFDSGVFHIAFPIAESREFLTAQHTRERIAAARSMRPFLEPRTIAVAGSFVAEVLRNLKGCRYSGEIYPVGPHEPTIEGLPACDTFRSIPADIDLAVIGLSGPASLGLVGNCANGRTRALLVHSPAATDIPRELAMALQRAARASGMRMIGPGATGILNLHPRVSMNATSLPSCPHFGSVSLLARSERRAQAVIERCARSGIGLSSFLAVGGPPRDVSGFDALSYWAGDDTTQVIVLDGNTLVEDERSVLMAAEVAQSKKVIVLAGSRPAVKVQGVLEAGTPERVVELIATPPGRASHSIGAAGRPPAESPQPRAEARTLRGRAAEAS